MLRRMIKKALKNYCRTWFNNRFNNLFLISIFYFAILILLILLGKRVFWPDEGIYIALGKYIFSKGNSGLFEPFRPFLLPLLLGLFWRVGINPLIFGYVFEFVSGLACVILTWEISEKLFGKKYALIASLFIITNLQFIINSTRIIADVPALAFAITSIYFFLNRKYFLSGLFSGMSFMTRFTYGILPVMMLAVYFIEKMYWSKLKNEKRNKIYVKKLFFEIISFITGLIITTAPYFIYSKISYGSLTWTLRSANCIVKSYAWFVEYSGFFTYLKKLFISMPLIVLSVLGMLCFLMALLSKKGVLKNFKGSEFTAFSLSALCSLCFLFYIIYFGIFVRQEARYVLHTIFFAAMLIAFGMRCLEKRLNILNKSLSKIFNAAVAILILISVAWQLNYITDIYKGEYYSKSEGELIEFLRNNIRNDDFLLTTTFVPAIYFDNKMLGFASYDYALGVLEQNKFRKGLIIVNTCAYGCGINDYECQLKRAEFLRVLEKEKLIFETKINSECSYRVYDNR
ncbi:MAG: ArnT family glycosyltransferase [Candidatus Woesearchaeota archaeon]